MKKVIGIVLILFFTSILYNLYSQSTNLTTLVNERRNMFQELNYNVRTKAQTINHKNCDNYFNDIIRLDDKISDEVHRVDSIIENDARILPAMKSSIEDLRVKKDTAMMYFYIILIIGISLTVLLIYIAVKYQQYQKKFIFLKADIEDANNNYSRVSDEKLTLSQEFKIKITSLENKLETLFKEYEVLHTENLELKNNTYTAHYNETNPNIILENRLLKEAIVELENKKNEFELEINSKELVIENKNLELETKNIELETKNKELDLKKKELEAEIESRKKDKRIIIGSPDETTEIVKRELAKRIDYLENALKTKEIMEGILAKKNSEMELKMKEISENYNLLITEFEDEKAYNTKLNNKLEFLEEELSDKELELKDVWSKVSSRTKIEKSTPKTNDPESNILKTLEKLNRLRQAEILNESEYSALKEKIINQM